MSEQAAPFTEVVIRAAANGHDLERLCRPLLGALAEFLRCRPRGDQVEIEVRDRGVGLANGIDLFAPFQRGEPDSTAEVAGVGLGLHVVRNLVEAMAGAVTADANEDGGSTFTVRLPGTP